MADEQVAEEQEQTEAAAEAGAETPDAEAADAPVDAAEAETPAEGEAAPEGEAGDAAPEGEAADGAAEGGDAAAEPAETVDASDEALGAVDDIESQLGEVLSNLEGLADGNLGGDGAGGGTATSIELLRDVTLNVKIELGRSRMFIEDILKLNEGSIVELEKLAGDPVDVFVNDRLVARGEVLVLNDNFCVRIGEIVTQE